MRNRITALLFSALLALSLAACSKKEQSQNPPASTDTSNQAQANQPAGGQMAPAQGQQMAQGPAQPMAPAPTAAAPAPEPPPPPPPLVVPAGTSMVVRMGSTLNTKTANDGDTFTGSLARAVAVHGEVAIPAGAGVTGTVVESKSPGKFKGEGVLTIALTAVNVGGAPESIQTSSYTVNVKGKGKRTAVAVGGGTGAGALIGGIAGGGKGALIGGLVGAGAGTAGAAFTGNKDLQIPAEQAVTFKLATPITVQRSVQPASNQPPAQ
jgi:predicted small lipoprotein YifL